MKRRRITTLWDLVSSLQTKMEGFGLDDEVVDAAVVIGVESMLADGRHQLRQTLERKPRRDPAPALGMIPIIAKA